MPISSTTSPSRPLYSPTQPLNVAFGIAAFEDCRNLKELVDIGTDHVIYI
jgi:hypothetical protein